MLFRKFNIVVLFLSLVAHVLNAAKITKAYHAFVIYDYFKAKKLAYNCLENEPALSSLLLAHIYYYNDNPFHHLDSAYKFIEQSWKFKLTEKDLLFLKKYGINQVVMNNLREKIHFSLYKNYFLTSNGYTIEQAEQFLSKYPMSNYRNQAFYKRDSLVFSESIKYKSSELMRERLLTYPETYFKHQFIEQEEFFRYKEFSTDENPNKIERYIHLYPESKYVANARDDLFEIALMMKNKGLLHRYIKQFPTHSSVETAWKMLYSLEVINYSDNNLAAFIEKYPDFPYKANIEREIELGKYRNFVVNQNLKFGCINERGDTLLPFEFDGIEAFSEGLAVVEKNNLFGYVNLNGDLVIPYLYEDAEDFVEGRAVVAKDGHYFIINRTGNYFSSAFDGISDYSNGYAIVKKNNLFGAIDKNGKILIPIIYQQLGEISQNLCFAKKNDSYGFIDHNGFTLIPFVFEWTENFKNGFARVKKDNRFGVLSTNGTYLIEPKFDRIEEQNGIYVVYKNNLYGFIDQSGCYLSSLSNSGHEGGEKGDFTDGEWMIVGSEIEQNLMNKNGKLLIEKVGFETIHLPKNGLIRFKQNEKYGFINSKGKIIIKPIYDFATDFEDSVCIVRKKNISYLLNTKGEILLETKSTELQRLNNLFYAYPNENNDWIICEKNGTVLLTEKEGIPETITSEFFIWENDSTTRIYDIAKRKFIFGG